MPVGLNKRLVVWCDKFSYRLLETVTKVLWYTVHSRLFSRKFLEIDHFALTGGHKARWPPVSLLTILRKNRGLWLSSTLIEHNTVLKGPSKSGCTLVRNVILSILFEKKKKKMDFPGQYFWICYVLDNILQSALCCACVPVYWHKPSRKCSCIRPHVLKGSSSMWCVNRYDVRVFETCPAAVHRKNSTFARTF